jgi:hypothetical protein
MYSKKHTFKWDLRTKCNKIKYCKKKEKEYICDSEVGQDFLGMTPKTIM